MYSAAVNALYKCLYSNNYIPDATPRTPPTASRRNWRKRWGICPLIKRPKEKRAVEAIAVIWVQWNKTKKWKMLFWRLPVRFLHVKRISFSPLKCFWIWKRICLKNFESHNTLSYRPVKRGKNYSQVSKTNLIPSWDVSNSKCLYLCLNNCKPHGMKVKTNHLRNSKAWSIHARTF